MKNVTTYSLFALAIFAVLPTSRARAADLDVFGDPITSYTDSFQEKDGGPEKTMKREGAVTLTDDVGICIASPITPGTCDYQITFSNHHDALLAQKMINDGNTVIHNHDHRIHWSSWEYFPKDLGVIGKDGKEIRFPEAAANQRRTDELAGNYYGFLGFLDKVLDGATVFGRYPSVPDARSNGSHDSEKQALVPAVVVGTSSVGTPVFSNSGSGN